MTIAETKKAIRALGMRCRWSSEWHEWRVMFGDITQKEIADGHGYYTDDNQDALDTAKAMLAHRYQNVD